MALYQCVIIYFLLVFKITRKNDLLQRQFYGGKIFVFSEAVIVCLHRDNQQ